MPILQKETNLMRSRLLLLVLVAMLFSLAACGPEPTPQEAAAEQVTQVAAEVAEASDILSLAASAWELEMIGSPGNELALIEGVTPTLNFFLKDYSGFAGCNYYLAAYDLDGNEITMTGPNMTRLVCDEPEGVGEQEATFIGILQNSTNFALAGDQLTLFTTGDQQLATLVRAEDLPLEGTTWSLKFYVFEGEIMPLIDNTTVTLTIDGDQASGTSGCNEYTGGVTVDGSSISFDQVASTMRACEQPEGIMDQESIYQALLDTAASFETGGSSLIIANAEDEAILLFAGEQ
jgi:heat shock protein HslJ